MSGNIKNKVGSTPWGKSTENSLKYFNIGDDQFDDEFIQSMLSIKRAMASANCKFKLLDQEHSSAILTAIQSIEKEDFKDYFPVKIWQTGSGTQVNMNINEVIATLANNLSNNEFHIHPNDHVNMSQSSNDVIPSALKLTALRLLNTRLLPELNKLEREFSKKSDEFKHIQKVGRTHLMDALPITCGQEFSAFAAQVELCINQFTNIQHKLKRLPLGATAVGTGVNCPQETVDEAIKHLSISQNTELSQDKNLFLGTSGNSDILELSSSMKNLSCSIMKISTDIAFLSSGPDTGLRELSLPHNEAGSSIMPGKVNPTQCEALQMVCCEVIGNDLSVSLAETHGHFQLNTFRPLLIKNIIDSIKILSDSLSSFRQYCLAGITINEERVSENVSKNKMIATFLAPTIGYDQAEKAVQNSTRNNNTIKRELEESGLISKQKLEELLSIDKTTNPPKLADPKSQNKK